MSSTIFDDESIFFKTAALTTIEKSHGDVSHFLGACVDPEGNEPGILERVSLGFVDNYRLCFWMCYRERPKVKSRNSHQSVLSPQAKGCEYDQEVRECVYHILQVARGNHQGDGPSITLCAVFWSLQQIDSQCGTATGEESFVVCYYSSGEAISAEGRVDLSAEVDACQKGWFCCPLIKSLNCPVNNFDPHHPAIEVD